jgi:hypothetical protein
LEGGAEIYAAGSPPKDGFELTAFLADRSMYTITDAGKVQGWASVASPINAPWGVMGDATLAHPTVFISV